MTNETQSFFKEHLLKHSLSQREIAKSIGMHDSDFSKVVQGRKSLPPQYLAPLCRKLYLSKETLLKYVTLDEKNPKKHLKNL